MLQIFALIGQVLQIFALYQNLHSCGYQLNFYLELIRVKIKTLLKILAGIIETRKNL